MPKIKNSSVIRPKEGSEGGRVPRRPRSVVAQRLAAGEEDQPKYSLRKTPISTKHSEHLRKMVASGTSDDVIPRRSRGRPRKVPEAQSAPDKLENVTPRRSLGFQRKRSYPYKFQGTEPQQKQKKLSIQKLASELLKGDAAKDSSGKQEVKKEEQEETKEPRSVRKARSDAIQRLAAVYEEQAEDDIEMTSDRAMTRVSRRMDPVFGAVGRKDKKEDKQKAKPAVLAKAGNVFPRRSVGRPRKSEDVKIIGLLKKEAGNGEETKEQKEADPAVPARAEAVLPRRSVGRPRKTQDLKDVGILKQEAGNEKKEEEITRVTRSKGPIVEGSEDKHKAKPASVKVVLKAKATVPAKASTVFTRRSVGRPKKEATGNEEMKQEPKEAKPVTTAKAVPAPVYPRRSVGRPRKNPIVSQEEKLLELTASVVTKEESKKRDSIGDEKKDEAEKGSSSKSNEVVGGGQNLNLNISNQVQAVASDLVPPATNNVELLKEDPKREDSSVKKEKKKQEQREQNTLASKCISPSIPKSPPRQKPAPFANSPFRQHSSSKTENWHVRRYFSKEEPKETAPLASKVTSSSAPHVSMEISVLDPISSEEMEKNEEDKGSTSHVSTNSSVLDPILNEEMEEDEAQKGSVHPDLIICTACSRHFLNPHGPSALISSSQLLYSHLERDHGIPMCSCGTSFTDQKSLRDHAHVICALCRKDLPPGQAADHERSHAAREFDCAKRHQKETTEK